VKIEPGFGRGHGVTVYTLARALQKWSFRPARIWLD
jgi:hypothetical protein